MISITTLLDGNQNFLNAELVTSIQGQKLFLCMKRIKFTTNFTIFILFFGMGLLQAFQNEEWLTGLFWIAIGLVFLSADSAKKPSE